MQLHKGWLRHWSQEREREGRGRGVEVERGTESEGEKAKTTQVFKVQILSEQQSQRNVIVDTI